MNNVVILAMPGNEALATGLSQKLEADMLLATVRRFPDGESYVRIESDIAKWDVMIVCSLHQPDDKLIPLMLLACAAHEAGANSVGLVAPYLAYMRQDKRFYAGETISAQHIGRLISDHVDWLVTVDPHLHRITDLSQVYSIPTRVVHAASRMALWIKQQIKKPLLIGPDEESAQWVSEVAALAQAPFLVLTKIRNGDRDVHVSFSDDDQRDVKIWRDHTPVLVDDMISTAGTMIKTVGHLKQLNLIAPVCVTVHAIFAQTAYEDLLAAGAADIVSCDTIMHPSNRIKLVEEIAAACVDLGVSQ